MELQEEVEARAEAIRALLPVLYSSLQEGRDGRRAQSYLLGRVRAAVCELVQLFERNQLRGGSRTGEFLNSMDAVLEGENNGASNHLQWAALADTAKSLVRHALAVAAAADSKHHDDNRDISVICRNIVERLQQAGLEGEEEEVEGSRQELLHLLELLEERVNSALLRQVTDHLSCVDQPLDSLVHRLS